MINSSTKPLPHRLRSAKGLRSRAFTLLELLVVITIIAVMSAGLVPTFLKNSDGYKIKDAVRRVADLMYYSHSMAVFESTNFRLNFDRETNSCWLTFEKNPETEPGLFHRYNASGYSGYTFQPGVAVQNIIIQEEAMEVELEQTELREGEYIEFRKDGTSEDALLVLVNEKQACYTIQVSGVTSTVRINKEISEGARSLVSYS